MANIVHFGKYYSPDTGGIESVTCSLARGAARAGHRVTVVCFQKSTAKNEDLLDGVRIVRVPLSRLIASQPLGFKYVLSCLREARQADIVHLHAPNMLAALCSLIIGKRPRLLVHWHSDVINKGMLGRLLRPLETALLKRADSIIATSRVYAEASPALRAFSNKVTVVPIGVPDAKHSPSTVSEESQLPRALLGQIEGKKVILAVGRLVPYKGFDVLIEAAKYLDSDAAVVIVGGGPLQDSLLHAIQSYGVSDKVCLAGRLSDECLHKLFATASMYCLPSTYRAEAFGVVLLEAMAYGLPIVATDIPGSGVPWVNKNGVSGINVPVGDAKALAEACNQLLRSERERLQLSQGARDRFLSKFTEDISVAKMMDTYDSLVSA